MKTIDEIVEALRAKGALDEEALLLLKREAKQYAIRSFVVCSVIFVSGKLGGTALLNIARKSYRSFFFINNVDGFYSNKICVTLSF